MSCVTRWTTSLRSVKLWPDERYAARMLSPPTPLSLRAGACYFALVFAAGFVLGTVRQLWLVPELGERLAELAEMPLMLVAIVLAAQWTVRRFGIAAALEPRLAVGGVALALLLAAEITLVLTLRGLTLADYVATRDPVSGAVYLAMLGVFAIMPALLGLAGSGNVRS